MALLADVPNRARFDIGGWANYRELPIRVRNEMIEQLNEWRTQEKTGRGSAEDGPTGNIDD